MKAFNFILDLAFRKWLQSFLKRIAVKYPDTFEDMLNDLNLKPTAKQVIRDRYYNDYKFDSYDYVDPRTAKNYHKAFLDEFIARQRFKN